MIVLLIGMLVLAAIAGYIVGCRNRPADWPSYEDGFEAGYDEGLAQAVRDAEDEQEAFDAQEVNHNSEV